MSAATATSVMKTFGNKTTVFIVRVTGAVLDPVLGKYSGGTTEFIQALAVTSRLPDSLIDGTRILIGDKRLTISAETPVLESDSIEISGKVYRVINIDAPTANDEVLYYRVICRG